MSDRFLGETCTESYKFLSSGTEHTFTFSFEPDKVIFYNLSKWNGIVANYNKAGISMWMKDQTAAANVYQLDVIASNATNPLFNFRRHSVNGFTVASTKQGPEGFRALISGVTKANPCVVTTTAAHGFQTGQVVMITDLGSVGSGITARGMDELNNKRFKIIVLSTTTFSLLDITTGNPVDSTNFVTWVSGGRITLETRVLSLNNPSDGTYKPNPYDFKEAVFKLTAGTLVMDTAGDVFRIEVIKYGNTIDLGQLS